jgi:hypothetical protein
VVIASAWRTEDTGFKSRQVVCKGFTYRETLQCCCEDWLVWFKMRNKGIVHAKMCLLTFLIKLLYGNFRFWWKIT